MYVKFESISFYSIWNFHFFQYYQHISVTLNSWQRCYFNLVSFEKLPILYQYIGYSKQNHYLVKSQEVVRCNSPTETKSLSSKTLLMTSSRSRRAPPLVFRISNSLHMLPFDDFSPILFIYLRIASWPSHCIV